MVSINRQKEVLFWDDAMLVKSNIQYKRIQSHWMLRWYQQNKEACKSFSH